MFFILLLLIEQRNLCGFQSVSPRGRFFGNSSLSKFNKSGKKSLNFEKRLRDHRKIIEDNESMLRRLQKKQSNFDVIRWHKEENDRKKLLINIKTYREEDVRKQQMMMEMTLNGGKSI